MLAVMLAPGQYEAVATDGSGETITIDVEGSEIRAGSFDYPNAKIRGLNDVYSAGQLMTQGSASDTFKFVAHGPQREYKIGRRL
jgi:hypothetical protein